MNTSKISKVALMVMLGILLVSVFWKKPLALCFLLTLAAYIKSFIMPIKKELVWFVITGIVGASAESLIMRSGPWSYASTIIVNFPVWLPFLWGYAGILGISLYEGLTVRK